MFAAVIHEVTRKVQRQDLSLEWGDGGSISMIEKLRRKTHQHCTAPTLRPLLAKRVGFNQPFVWRNSFTRIKTERGV